MGCVSTHVSFSQTRKARIVWELAPLLPRQELCHRVLDPQQWVARVRHHVWKNHMNLANFAIFQFVRMTFVNLLLIHMTFVNPLLVHMTFVNFAIRQLARMTSVHLQLARMTFVTFVHPLLVRMNFLEFCESPARTHDFP